MQCFIDDFVLVKQIGKGNFGEVYLTQRKGTSELYATKKMNRKECERPPLQTRLINEIQILQMVNHPNIVKYIDLKKSLNNWYLITEYVGGGSLLDNLKRYISIYRRAFPEDIVQHFMKQILDALNYLHFNRIIHRDLKLDNILLSYPSEYDKQSLNLKSAQVKLIDFGFATILPVNKDVTFTALGTPPNMDPKILEQFNTGVKNPGYNEKIDIWSLGTLCYEMVVGHSPFVASNIKELYQKVKQGNYTIPSSLSEEIVTFIDEMLQQDTNERADTNKLLNHKFLVNPVNTFHPSNIRSLKATFLPGGLINMKSKKTKQQYNYNNNMNIWEIFNQPEFYTVQTNQYTNQIPVQVQVQPQIQHQPKMQVQVQPQIQHQPQQQPYNPYGVQQYQTNAYYNNQAQNNYEYYY